jgi:transposase
MVGFDWTIGDRWHSNRCSLRHPSDLTDYEWALVRPVVPTTEWMASRRTADLRQIVDGLLYVLSSDPQWSAIPKDLPPRTMLSDYLRRWAYDGTLVRVHRALYGSMEPHINSKKRNTDTSGAIMKYPRARGGSMDG